MAVTDYHPDPYQGWSVVNPGSGNITARQIMTDTSGAWRCIADYGVYRRYAYRTQ